MSKEYLFGCIVAVIAIVVTGTGHTQMQIMGSERTIQGDTFTPPTQSGQIIDERNTREGFVLPGFGLVDFGEFRQAAPIAISGDNIHIAWSTNSTGNNEVMFRASTDSGTIFGEKINLSNSTDSDSTRVELDSDGENVAVTWWETNQTDDTPVMRVSNDNGTTFGPMLKLATNGSISGDGGGGGGSGGG